MENVVKFVRELGSEGKPHIYSDTPDDAIERIGGHKDQMLEYWQLLTDREPYPTMYYKTRIIEYIETAAGPFIEQELIGEPQFGVTSREELSRTLKGD